MTDKKFTTCLKMMRKLVSDIQGAPYPGENFELELYKIWYEHVQHATVECLQYLDDNYPMKRTDFSKTLEKLFEA